jgi:hypothetical protein
MFVGVDVEGMGVPVVATGEPEPACEPEPLVAAPEPASAPDPGAHPPTSVSERSSGGAANAKGGASKFFRLIFGALRSFE